MTHEWPHRRGDQPGRRLDLDLADEREGDLERRVDERITRVGGGPTPSEAAPSDAPDLPKRDLHDLEPGTVAAAAEDAGLAGHDVAPAAREGYDASMVYGPGTSVYATRDEPAAESVEAVPAAPASASPLRAARPRREPGLAERATHALEQATDAPAAIAGEVRAAMHEVLDEARKALLGGIAGAFLAFMALVLFTLAAAAGLNRMWGGENGFLAVGALYAVLAVAAMLVAFRGARGVRREAARGAERVKAEVADRAQAIAQPPPARPRRY